MSRTVTVYCGRSAAVVLLLSCLSAPSNAAEKSVQEFVALKSRWSNFAAIKQEITVEGRVSTFSSTKFRLRHCGIVFDNVAVKSLPKLQGKSRTVAVTGYLVEEFKRFVFHVKQIREIPSDVAIFKKKARTLPIGRPDAWYGLAKWARNRGVFYKDAELLLLADSAFRSGMISERDLLGVSDSSGLLKLATRAKEMKLLNLPRQEWVHSAHRLRWQSYLRSGAPTLAEVTAPLKQDLPGSFTPLKTLDEKLAAAYAKNAELAYRSADKKTRQRLHRLFYIEMQLREVNKLAAADGSNGGRIATLIEKIIPEHAALAGKYRELALVYNVDHADTLERREVIELAETLRERKQPDRATAAIKRWLTAQIVKRRKNGAAGLVLLADDYRQLLGDKTKAISYLKEADRLSPKSRIAAERLNRLGLVRRNGQWVKGANNAPARPAKVETVNVGMTQAKVREVMFGAPDAVTRIAAGRVIHEVWVFGKRTQDRYSIHFVRGRTESRSFAKVVNVSRLPAEK